MLGTALCLVVTTVIAGCGSPESEPAAPPAPPPVTVQIEPADGADAVAPSAPMSATVAHGRVTNVVLSNDEGKPVPGEIAPDGSRWTATAPLAYDKQYTLTATAQGASGPPVTTRSTFHTVAPKEQTYVSMNPLNGQTVGVGQPLAFYFSKNAPPPDKARVEQAIKVHTEPAVEGAFYWYDNREVHWRPKQPWAPGTKVTIDANIYGKDLGNGVYGEADRHAQINIGDAVVLRADGASHQMSIEVNGAVQRTIPVSLGKPSAPSRNGTHVVSEKHENYMMDSSTFGLPADSSGGYRTNVKSAVRISNGGEFLHAAPWSVGDQGRRNVSHGCINMSDANARDVFNLLTKGSIVEITNSGGPDLKPTDGFGDWQVPWQEWLKGNK